jgi:hypothetical protein
MAGTPDGMAGSLPAKQGGPDDIQTAWKILAGGAPIAAAALVDIADHGKSEVARVQASQAILDRVGLATPKERPQVTFAVIPKEFQETLMGPEQLSPAQVIRNRLKELAGPTAALVEGQQEAVAQAMGLGAYGTASEHDDGAVVDAELMPLEGAHGDEDDWGNPWS